MVSHNRHFFRLGAAALVLILFFSAVFPPVPAGADGAATLGDLLSGLAGTNETINTALYLSKAILEMKDGTLPEDSPEAGPAPSAAEPDRDQLARLREAQAKYTALILALVTKNAKSSMRPEVITIDGKSVITLGMSTTLDTDALCTIVETLLTRTEELEEYRKAAALLLELSAAGLGKTGDQLLSQLRTDAAASIREMNLGVTLSLNTSIKTGGIARMLLKVSTSSGPFAIRYSSAAKGSGTLEFLTDAGQLFCARYSGQEITADPYTASLSLTGKQFPQTELIFRRSRTDSLWHLDAFLPSTGEETALTFQIQEDSSEAFLSSVILREQSADKQQSEKTIHIDLKKADSTFRVTTSGGSLPASLTGQLEKDGSNTRIRIDSINGLPTHGLSLTVPKAKLPTLTGFPSGDSLSALQQSILSMLQNGAVSMLIAP